MMGELLHLLWLASLSGIASFITSLLVSRASRRRTDRLYRSYRYREE